MKKAHNRIEMEGKHYNNWKVLSHIETVDKIPYYQCLCLGCNELYKVDGRNVRSGRSKECVKCAIDTTRQKNIGTTRTKRSIEELKAVYLKRQIKAAAIKREYEFVLTPEQVWELSQQNCTYCNTPPEIKTSNIFIGHGFSEKILARGVFPWNGIDRADNSKGYTIDNCVPCCQICNRAKKDMKLEDFAAWALRLAEHIMKLKNK